MSSLDATFEEEKPRDAQLFKNPCDVCLVSPPAI